ncbi:quinone oxidoreductase [Colletotrichum truncatum]|uniref:Quinone oxidoreductase n=1 Tax=Colletotrichum truncatum TaxID=5467 RepID=A0ACC3ZDI0_COLTU|nr:quinone oxidoreductase [Colletotrichum truncatum]KAF6797929.1 quinone oxidoreductase [Colletotrichum truncatum]
MLAAVVNTWDSEPNYTTVPDLPDPSPTEIRLRVLASGVHRLVISRARGRHYSAKTLPHNAGVDGIGEDPNTGQRYYFFTFESGSFAEFVNVDRKFITTLPENADPVATAAFVNPVSSAWMAFTSRAAPQFPGFSVAILGVTSTSGRAAVDVARAKGAGRIIGVARNAAALAEIPVDERIVLSPETDWSSLGEVDVVLDYIYGSTAVKLFRALPESEKEVQYVHIGALGLEGDITVPGSYLRGKKLAIRGVGPGSWTMEEYAREIRGMVDVATQIERKNIFTAPFKDFEKTWANVRMGGEIDVFISDDIA